MRQDPELQGCSILFYSKKEDHRVPYIAPDYAYGIEQIDKIVNRGGRLVNEKMSGSDCWWFEYGGSRDTISMLKKKYPHYPMKLCQTRPYTVKEPFTAADREVYEVLKEL